jgi:hypothetical protein
MAELEDNGNTSATTVLVIEINENVKYPKLSKYLVIKTLCPHLFPRAFNFLLFV